MKKIVLLLALLIGFLANSQTTFEWAKSIGGQNFEDANSIVLDAQGNVYITGRFQKFVGTQVDFDPGPGVYNIGAAGQYDAFVVKLNANGDFQWAKSFGGATINNTGTAGIVSGNGITVDTNGNVYTTGTFTYNADFDPSPTTDFVLTAINQFGNAATDVFISKLDSNGNFVWAKRIGAQFFEEGVSITADTNNNVIVTGKFAGTVNFNTSGGTSELTGVSSSSGFILKLDNNGNFGWVKSIRGAGAEVVYAVAVDNYGNVFATGNFASATDLDTGTSVYKITGSGIFVLKLDASGNFIFAKGFVGNSNLDCTAIKVDASGNIFTTGSFLDTVDFDPSATTYNLNTDASSGQDVFLSKLDNLGNFVWAKRLYTTAADSSNSLALDNLGNIYISPNFRSVPFKIDNGSSIFPSTQFSYNLSILKFDTAGTLVAKNFVAGLETIRSYIAVDSNYSVVSYGTFGSTKDFNPDTPIFNLTSNGQSDVFISKIKLKNETLSVNKDNQMQTIALYPNPTHSNLNIQVANSLVKANIKLISILGQTVLEKQNVSGTNVSLDVSGLGMGTYIIQIKEGHSINTSKFIKQ